MVSENAQEQIERLERELIEAFGRGDAVALDRLLADGFVFTDPTGDVVAKHQFLGEIRARELVFETVELEALEVRSFGETAVAHGRVAMTARSRRRPYQGRFSYVDVYTRAGDTWQLVLSTGERASIISGEASPDGAALEA